MTAVVSGESRVTKALSWRGSSIVLDFVLAVTLASDNNGKPLLSASWHRRASSHRQVVLLFGRPARSVAPSR